MCDRKHILAVAVVALTPLAYVWKYVHGSKGTGLVSFDIYTEAYPLTIQAVAAAKDGGRGLFWNAMQSCGQPFFGSGITGLLYPGNLLFWVADPDTGLYALLAFNFLVACLSAYFLCVQLGMGPFAACCGGLCFGLGASSVTFNSSTPLLGSPYVWFPAAMLFCERILRSPSIGDAFGLALAIAMALIPGHPQFVFYLLQLIAARFLWELVTRWSGMSWRTLTALLGGLIFAPLLIAVQLIPAFEVGIESIRGRALEVGELSNKFVTWAAIRNQLAWRWDNGQPFLVLPCILAAAAVLYRPGRRVLFFYALVGVLALDLSLGPNGFTFSLYAKLPLVTLFRNPERILIITSFCIALLAAAGLEAAAGPSIRGSVQTAAAMASLLLAGFIGLYWLIPTALTPSERWLGVLLLIAATIGAARDPVRPLIGTVIIVALVLHLVYFRNLPISELLPDGAVLFSNRPVYAALQQEMTPQDRTYLVPRRNDHSLQQKTGALFGVPAIFDYHSQISQRFADYFYTLRAGTAERDYNQWAYALGGLLPPTLHPRLLNLAAGRFIVVPSTFNLKTKALRLFEFDSDLSNGRVHVYRNYKALPRAFFVPRVEVVPDPAVLLARLATGDDDLRQVALVESIPAAGFTGEAIAAAPSPVTFVRNDPERLALRVIAPVRGFLFLADQYFPGWYATVNGAPTPIERANYVFRLISVPAGDSIVELRYAPWSLKLGAATSAAAWTIAAAWLLRAARNRFFLRRTATS